MKKLKKFLALTVATALCALLPNVNSLTAFAAPNTYIIKYIDGESGWHFQPSNTWNDENEHRELYYMQQAIKDGDTVIVKDGAPECLNLTLSVRLGNLSLTNASNAVITAKGYDECHIMQGTVASVNGAVSNAYVYGNGSCTFNSNVNTMHILGDTDIVANVSCKGTVDHLIGKDNSNTYYDFYNFAADKLLIENGSVKTEEAYFSKTAPLTASAPVASATVQTPAAPTQAANTSANDYDDVPKTGESSAIYLLLGISLLCFTGKYALKKI